MSYIIFSNSDSPVLNFDCIGYSKNPVVTRFGPAQREQYIIHYVISGKGFFNGNEVKKGQGFIITPNSLEYYYPDKNNPWEFLWVISSDNRFKGLLNNFNADKNTYIFDHSAYEQINNVIENIKLKNNNVVCSNEILEMFLNIYNSHTKESEITKQKTNSEIYLDFAINYINNNISKTITITSLTEILGISQVYLFKIFKNKFGISTKQYINECRLKKAKKLLTDTNLSITQIAASVGFNDVLAFSKFFSKNTAISPQNYRSNKQNNTN